MERKYHVNLHNKYPGEGNGNYQGHGGDLGNIHLIMQLVGS